MYLEYGVFLLVYITAWEWYEEHVLSYISFNIYSVFFFSEKEEIKLNIQGYGPFAKNISFKKYQKIIKPLFIRASIKEEMLSPFSMQ